MEFLDNSPCNFLAVDTVKKILTANGFKEKKIDDKMTAKAGEKFFFTKNDSAIFAVQVGKKKPADTGFKIIAAHSDSPCFRIKPASEIPGDGGILRLNTEVYGGPILYTWFDRPLSLAGRVLVKGKDALHPVTKLLKIDRPLMCISHLAIHFNRAVNEGNHLSKQKDMLPILAKINSDMEWRNTLLNLIADESQVEAADIIGQTEQVMKNLGAVLEAAGSSFDKAVKTTCFLADMNDFATFNEIYGRYFTSLPARSCVAVKTLPKNVLVEVEVIAEIDKSVSRPRYSFKIQ